MIVTSMNWLPCLIKYFNFEPYHLSFYLWFKMKSWLPPTQEVDTIQIKIVTIKYNCYGNSDKNGMLNITNRVVNT